MSVQTLPLKQNTDAIWEAKVHLAAALRLVQTRKMLQDADPRHE